MDKVLEFYCHFCCRTLGEAPRRALPQHFNICTQKGLHKPGVSYHYLLLSPGIYPQGFHPTKRQFLHVYLNDLCKIENSSNLKIKPEAKTCINSSRHQELNLCQTDRCGRLTVKGAIPLILHVHLVPLYPQETSQTTSVIQGSAAVTCSSKLPVTGT